MIVWSLRIGCLGEHPSILSSMPLSRTHAESIILSFIFNLSTRKMSLTELSSRIDIITFWSLNVWFPFKLWSRHPIKDVCCGHWSGHCLMVGKSLAQHDLNVRHKKRCQRLVLSFELHPTPAITFFRGPAVERRHCRKTLLPFYTILYYTVQSCNTLHFS